MTTARFTAVNVLNQARSANSWASDLVDAELNRSTLSQQDRRFVTQLVFGVIRRKGTLDALLRPFIQRPFHQVEPELLDALRVGAYQLAFLTQIPAHAAVDETVKLAVPLRRPQAKGFLNGVCRRVAELVTNEFGEAPASDALPVDAGHADPKASPRYRKLAKPLFPDPVEKPADYLAAAFSWPRWLAEKWLEQFGFEEATRLGFWFNSPPPLWLRVNKLSLDREAYQLLLAAQGIDATAGSHPQSLRLEDTLPIRQLPGYGQGEFAVQDHSSILVASALQPQPGWSVLDLCAAPGGKTTHLAELMDNRGRIVACDIDQSRLDTVMSLCRRLKVGIVEPQLLDKQDTQPPPGPYHAALVDVPCSNTGVLGRRPEVRWRLHHDEFEELVRLQTRLLLTAVEAVKPGGVIVYSTCSIDPLENEGVVRNVCRALKGLKLEAESYAVPGQPSDGGYWARLRKSA